MCPFALSQQFSVASTRLSNVFDVVGKMCLIDRNVHPFKLLVLGFTPSD